MELRDPFSIQHLYRRLLATRRRYRALSEGSYRRLLTQPDILLYARQAGSECILIALNFESKATSTLLPSGAASGVVLVSSFGDREREHIEGRINLRANEGVVIGPVALR
jgi:alpha-glucosidase